MEVSLFVWCVSNYTIIDLAFVPSSYACSPAGNKDESITIVRSDKVILHPEGFRQTGELMQAKAYGLCTL